MEKLSVREMNESDIPYLVKYWTQESEEHYLGMGVDMLKLASAEDLEANFRKQISLDPIEAKAYATIWELNGNPIGHCNINTIKLGDAAHMHLHIWDAANREKGYGSKLLKLSLPLFFEIFGLQVLKCEPYALNQGPNAMCEKAGFEFIKTYMTSPSFMSFEQETNQWIMTRARFEELYWSGEKN